MTDINPDVVYSVLQSDLFAAGWDGLESQEHDSVPGRPLRQIAMSSISRSIVKKFHNDRTDVGRDYAALALFLECNEACRTFTGAQPNSLVDEIIIGEIKSILYDFFNPRPQLIAVEGMRRFSIFREREPLLLNLSDIAKHFGTGNGSNIGVKSTDKYMKYVCSTMSATDSSLPILYRQAISSTPDLKAVEFERAAVMGYEIVRGNKLSFVPKSRVISRTICTEPLLNMFFQLGIGGVITDRLREVFQIDLSKQPDRNATLAHTGSCNGSFATIDLSSASDTVSLTLLKELIPPEPLRWLMLCRSPTTVLPSGEELELHMVSSMGNGFTFPLQTAIFAAVVTAVYRCMGFKPTFPSNIVEGPIKQVRETEFPGNFSVFGDDIIVDTRAYDTVVRVLGLLGFKVNVTKSFNNGDFRESCGHDYIRGENVRGVYIQTLLHDADHYSAINRINRWSARHGIKLPGVISLLRGRCKGFLVPPGEPDTAGIHVPFALTRGFRRDCTGAIKYYALVQKTCSYSPDTVGLKALGERRNSIGDSLPKGFFYSEQGLMVALLAGWLRHGRIGVRLSGKAVFQLKRRVCPSWDSTTFTRSERIARDERWSTFVSVQQG